MDTIDEGAKKDIVFSDADQDYFYINRGFEEGLNLKETQNKVLNKKATLHLSKNLRGRSCNHIVQMLHRQEII